MLPSILDRSFWDAASSDANLADFWAHIDRLVAPLALTPPIPTAADFLAAKRHNNRGLLDHHWGSDRTQFAALILDRCRKGIEADDIGSDNTDDRLLNWLWAFLTEPSWSVSAHLPAQDLPQSGVPCLDLASCEMASFMAEALEVLRPWIESVSATLADSIVTEIDRRVLTPYADGFSVWWDEDMSRINNWVGVCAGSILAACESLAAQGQPRSKARERAIKGLQLFFESAFTPGGECDEGISYWVYGVEFACYGLSRLSRADLEGNFDMERLHQVASYPRRAHLFGETFYAGNDAPLQTPAHLFVCDWLADAMDEPFLLEWGRESLRLHGVHSDKHFGLALRTLQALQRGLMSPLAPPNEKPLAENIGSVTSRLLPDQQAAILSVPGNEGGFLACLGGGNNAERHNHNDLGHFLLAFDQKWIVPDFGAPFYTADFFGPNRYTYLTASSRGHACPLVNGCEQIEGAGAQAEVLVCDLERAEPEFKLELSKAYPPEARLVSWQRSLRVAASPEPLARIGDHFQTEVGQTPITHVFWTLQEIELVTETETMLVLRIGGVECEVTPAPHSFTVTSHSPADLRLRQFRDRTLYQFAAAYTTGAAGVLNLETRFRPTASYEAL